jgi:hypothetical protein
MSTKKTLQRKKPGFTKSGVAKIVSMSVKQLVAELDRTQKKKVKAKISRRLNHFGYVAPAVVEEEEVVVE